MDWNWFYSSLAQSVAALVGIFAAFIITKVVNNQGEFARKAARVREILNTSEKYREAASLRSFRWLNERKLERVMKELEGILKDGKEELTPEAWYGLLTSVKYVPRDELLQKFADAILQYRPKPASSKRVSTEGKIFESRGMMRDIMPIATPREFIVLEAQQKAKLTESIEDEGELISALLLEVRQQIRSVKHYLSEVEGNPESSGLVSFSIICALLLFVFGVIYPLSFLPFDNTGHLSAGAFFTILFSLKGVMLALVTVIVVTIMGAFWFINSRLRYRKDDLEELREVSELKYYSEYFEIEAKNVREQQEWSKTMTVSPTEIQTGKPSDSS